LAAGYESADIDFTGMHTVPGANADKELTEKGASCIIPTEEPADLFLQLGGISELKWRAGSAVLARDGYHSGAVRLSSITQISCDKFFRCNGHIFLRSLKPANFHVLESC
jgi:hypothetical protein